MTNMLLAIQNRSVTAIMGKADVRIHIATAIAPSSGDQFQDAIRPLASCHSYGYQHYGPAEYFVVEEQREATYHGRTVYCVPERDYPGIHGSDAQEAFGQLGTLLHVGDTLIVCTDRMLVEYLRRGIEVSQMKAGDLECPEHGRDYMAYLRKMSELDAQSENGVYFRGHGLELGEYDVAMDIVFSASA